jgi:hypothetical protein
MIETPSRIKPLLFEDAIPERAGEIQAESATLWRPFILTRL